MEFGDGFPERRQQRIDLTGRGGSQEYSKANTCQLSPVGGGIPMLCGMSVIVGGLYIAAVHVFRTIRFFSQTEPLPLTSLIRQDIYPVRKIGKNDIMNLPRAETL